MTIGLQDDKGAHFYRCDFQVHTPRDTQWKGDSSASPDDRRAYAASFVEHCRSIDLNAVAITDHHDFAYFPFLRQAAEEETRPDGTSYADHEKLVVFPGLELTFGSPTMQAILILDANFPEDRLANVLLALSVEPVDASIDQIPQVESIDHIRSLLDLHDEMDKRPWLKGKYIVLPNVTDKGYKTMMRSGMKVAYREMPCVGGYLDGSFEKIGTGNKSKFAGEDENYGNKRLALFQTSDSRAATFADLGRHSTWVKWTAPTAEALRQACLANESRISQVEPQLPNAVVSKMVVSNSKFLGPLTIDFNQQYNAVIGGRGTGKSTILSYLRWGLCDQPADHDQTSSEAGSIGARQRRLIEATLFPLDAQVEVHFVINGIPHVVRRQADTGNIRLKIGGADFVPAREEDVRALLPIHAYSQKQLSSVAVRVDELTRFITAPIQPDLDEFDRQIAEAAGRLRENYATLQRVRVLDLAIQRSTLDVGSLEDQAENIRQSLGGMSEEDRVILADKPRYDAARDIQRSARESLTQASSALVDARSALDALNVGEADGSASQPSKLAEPIEELVTIVGATIQTVVDRVEAAQTELRAASDVGSPVALAEARLNEIHGDFGAAYETVKATSTAHEAKLAELAVVEGRVTEVKDLRTRQTLERSGLGDPETSHHELRAQVGELAKARSATVAHECLTLDGLSDGLIHAELQQGVGLSKHAERLRAGIAGSGVRSARVEALFDAIRAEDDPLATWNTVLDELEALLQLGSETPVKSSNTPVMSRLGFPVADQDKSRHQLTSDGWLDLALTPVLDHPRFKYRVKESDYIDFSDASAGQQATALLRVLLAQAGPPLIVDQPEDDLDSQVVLDVVRRLWSSKARRQLIFSSHNANLVVNLSLIHI